MNSLFHTEVQQFLPRASAATGEQKVNGVSAIL